MIEKDYMGDGVYIEQEDLDGSIVLTTENGIDITNSIYIEPQVWDAIKRYMQRVEDDGR